MRFPLLLNTPCRRLAALSIAFLSGLAALLALLGWAELQGLETRAIGYLFLLAPLLLCVALGAVARTSPAGRPAARPRIPAIFSAMISASEWVSAAGLLGLAGGFYFFGLAALAWPAGWLLGYLLLTLLLAPRLRVGRLGRLPDFLDARFGGRAPRLAGVAIQSLSSFVYLLAQITAIGLIVSHFAGIRFDVGVFVGLAGVLMCSFLGDLRRLAWAQIVQFLFRAAAFLIPVVLVSWQLTGQVLPQFSYATLIGRLEPVESRLAADPREEAVREQRLARSRQLDRQIAELPDSLSGARSFARARLDRLLAKPNATGRQIAAAQRALHELPRTAEEAKKKWRRVQAEDQERAKPLIPLTDSMPTDSPADFWALILVLMLGTAAMPHLVERASASPAEAPSRQAGAWTLMLILLLLAAAPACAVFTKWLITTQLVGQPFDTLPGWIASWSRQGLIRVEDINQDGILQLAEFSLKPDLVVLALPELAGLSYVATGLIAAAVLSAALGMADARLQAIARALTDEICPRTPSTQLRLIIGKLLLLAVALLAAALAMQRPASILTTVGFAFALAAAGLFPTLILGLFWRRASRWGALSGMITGTLLALYHATLTHPLFGGSSANGWLGLGPLPGTLYGIAGGLAAIVVVSLLSPAPSPRRTDSTPRLEKSTD